MKYLSIFIRVALLALGQSCQWSKPDGYGKISQCITTTKHNKAKTVCIFLGIYCTCYHQIYHFWSPSHNTYKLLAIIQYINSPEVEVCCTHVTHYRNKLNETTRGSLRLGATEHLSGPLVENQYQHIELEINVTFCVICLADNYCMTIVIGVSWNYDEKGEQIEAAFKSWQEIFPPIRIRQTKPAVICRWGRPCNVNYTGLLPLVKTHYNITLGDVPTVYRDVLIWSGNPGCWHHFRGTTRIFRTLAVLGQ